MAGIGQVPEVVGAPQSGTLVSEHGIRSRLVEGQP
jgi:hypothetical protein